MKNNWCGIICKLFLFFFILIYIYNSINTLNIRRLNCYLCSLLLRKLWINLLLFNLYWSSYLTTCLILYLLCCNFSLYVLSLFQFWLRLFLNFMWDYFCLCCIFYNNFFEHWFLFFFFYLSLWLLLLNCDKFFYRILMFLLSLFVFFWFLIWRMWWEQRSPV